jgi:TetR/AcrR family transcriptional repressor of bet genes
MGPIRREQICRAASTVIAREGLAGTTMRVVAEEAGVSTGMLNHYFANRQDMLMHAVQFVSERAHGRMLAAIEGLAPGRQRLTALLDSMLIDGDDQNAGETWRVWITAYGEAVRQPELRQTLESRLKGWFELLDTALEGVIASEPEGAIPWSRRLDAMLNGLAIRALTSETGLDSVKVRDEVLSALLPAVPVEA